MVTIPRSAKPVGIATRQRKRQNFSGIIRTSLSVHRLKKKKRTETCILSKGVDLSEDGAESPFGKVGSSSLPRRSPEDRASDLEKALSWLRNEGKDDEINDPTGEFRKLDSMLPKKAGQSPEARAREIEGALDWVRSSTPDDVSCLSDAPFQKIGSSQVSRRSPEDRVQALENALNWIRNKGKNDNKNDPAGEFRKLDALFPKRSGQTPEQRAREIEGCLDWMRGNKVAPEELKAMPLFGKKGFVPTTRRTPEQRVKDLEGALDWVRNDVDSNDPAGEFRKLDSMLPKKAGQSPENHAREIEGASDWLRNEHVGPAGEDSVAPFARKEDLVASPRSPEDRNKDLDNILNWMRKGGKKKQDPSGEFRKLDSLLPNS